VNPARCGLFGPFVLIRLSEIGLGPSASAVASTPDDFAGVPLCAKLCVGKSCLDWRSRARSQKPATRPPAARAITRAPAARSTATRRDVERRITRVEKLLDDGGDALQLLGTDMGRGGRDAYKELTRTARAYAATPRERTAGCSKTSRSSALPSRLLVRRGARRLGRPRVRTAPAPRPGHAGQPARRAPAARARPRERPPASGRAGNCCSWASARSRACAVRGIRHCVGGLTRDGPVAAVGLPPISAPR
jgi:hypothetical protein